MKNKSEETSKDMSVFQLSQEDIYDAREVKLDLSRWRRARLMMRWQPHVKTLMADIAKGHIHRSLLP